MDLTALKKQINQSINIEGIHHQLEKLNEDDAIEIVRSMSDSKIYKNVNLRKFQDSYICDYLAYLFQIDEDSFWKHVIASFDLNEGLLWGDDMIHCRRIQQGPIPEEVWKAFIYFALKVEEKQDIDAMACVLQGQLQFRDESDVDDFIGNLPQEEQEEAKSRAKYLLETLCTYSEF